MGPWPGGGFGARPSFAVARRPGRDRQDPPRGAEWLSRHVSGGRRPDATPLSYSSDASRPDTSWRPPDPAPAGRQAAKSASCALTTSALGLHDSSRSTPPEYGADVPRRIRSHAARAALLAKSTLKNAKTSRIMPIASPPSTCCEARSYDRGCLPASDVSAVESTRTEFSGGTG